MNNYHEIYNMLVPKDIPHSGIYKYLHLNDVNGVYRKVISITTRSALTSEYTLCEHYRITPHDDRTVILLLDNHEETHEAYAVHKYIYYKFMIPHTPHTPRKDPEEGLLTESVIDNSEEETPEENSDNEYSDDNHEDADITELPVNTPQALPIIPDNIDDPIIYVKYGELKRSAQVKMIFETLHILGYRKSDNRIYMNRIIGDTRQMDPNTQGSYGESAVKGLFLFTQVLRLWIDKCDSVNVPCEMYRRLWSHLTNLSHTYPDRDINICKNSSHLPDFLIVGMNRKLMKTTTPMHPLKMLWLEVKTSTDDVDNDDLSKYHRDINNATQFMNIERVITGDPMMVSGEVAIINTITNSSKRSTPKTNSFDASLPLNNKMTIRGYMTMIMKPLTREMSLTHINKDDLSRALRTTYDETIWSFEECRSKVLNFEGILRTSLYMEYYYENLILTPQEINQLWCNDWKHEKFNSLMKAYDEYPLTQLQWLTDKIDAKMNTFRSSRRH